MTGARKIAFALDGLIRSRTKGDGGEVFARKCIGEIADGIEEVVIEANARLAALDRFEAAGWKIADDGDPYREDDSF